MPKKQSGDDLTRKGEKRQRTEKGLTTPVPSPEEFFRDLGKAVPKADPPDRSGSGSADDAARSKRLAVIETGNANSLQIGLQVLGRNGVVVPA
jgi:hypothetical protein